MGTKYFTLLTQVGAKKLAAAIAAGKSLELVQMGVGDGNGVLPTPDPVQTKLVNERRRGAINALTVDPNNTNQMIAEQVIPENEGGFWLREIGLYDVDGDLIAVGNCPETYKPELKEGSGRVQTVRMILIVSHTDAITLKFDPTVALVTRRYVDTLLADHMAAINPHQQYAPIESPALTGVPTAPTVNSRNNSSQIATTAFVYNALSETLEPEIARLQRRSGDVIFLSEYMIDDYASGMDIDSAIVGAVAAINAVPNTEFDGKPVVLAFPSGKFTHSVTMWFTRPVILASNGDTQLEFTGNGNQIIFGPDGIRFNGIGGHDHRLHVRYGFDGLGTFTFTGNLSNHGIVFNEYITNPRLLGLKFYNYGSEEFYQIKLWGNCWDIYVDHVRHVNSLNKAVNFLSANGKMKDGTVDYGNSRLHVGRDVHLHNSGSRSGGICFDAGGVDYVFNGVVQGWRVTHQLGSFASNPRINGYHETIYPQCEALITYGGTPDDTVVRDDGYFDGGIIGGDGIYWNAHHFSGPEGYPPSNCIFMKPGRSDVVLRNCHIGNIDLTKYDSNRILVTTNIINGIPSYGNSWGRINYPSVQIHQQNALCQPWTPQYNIRNIVANGSGRLSRAGTSFELSANALDVRLMDFYSYQSDGSAQCNIYRNPIGPDTQFTHDGTTINIVVPNSNSDNKIIRIALDRDVFKCQGREVTLSFMAINGNPGMTTKITANLFLVFSSSGSVARAYSFGEFTIPNSWALCKFTLNIPFEGVAYAPDSGAFLTFHMPKNQPSNIQMANINLYQGTVAVQGPGDEKDWEVLAQSIAYYGS